MRRLALLVLAMTLALPAVTHAHGFSRGFVGYRSFRYGVPVYSYVPSYGYVPNYVPSYAPSYSYAPAYTPSYYYVLPQPVLVAPAVSAQAPAAVPAATPAQTAPVPLPPPMPQAAAPVYVPPAPTYAAPTPTLIEQELQQGYLSVPTVSYLSTLSVYDRYEFLHRHYRHGFADRQFTRHFGTIPGTFRNRLRGLTPRTSNNRGHR